jgi:hypothetical protein
MRINMFMDLGSWSARISDKNAEYERIPVATPAHSASCVYFPALLSLGVK